MDNPIDNRQPKIDSEPSRDSALFQWRIEEDRQPEVALEPAMPVKHKPGQNWRLFLAALLLLVAGLLVYSQLNRRLAAATVQLTAEVETTHQLAQQAAMHADAELFATLLWQGDYAWVRLQQRLRRDQLYLDRAAFGLWFETTHPVEVRFAPDLTQAELIEWVTYQWPADDAVASVHLERTALYRREMVNGNWLLAPPPNASAFWGDWITVEGERLTLIFPARDETIGRRLAADLAELLSRFCVETAVRCPPQFHLQLRLDRDPQSLLILAQHYQTINLRARGVSGSRQLHVELPAPTLVGRPLDEAGYNALLAGYGGWIITVLAHDFSHQAGVTLDIGQELARLGLRRPLLSHYHPATSQPPRLLPPQDVQLLCVTFDPAQLWRYRPDVDVWQGEWMTAADHGLNFMREGAWMAPFPGGQGVLIGGRQAVDGVNRWRIYHWSAGEARLLLDHETLNSVAPWLMRRIHPDGRYLPVSPTPDWFLPFGPVSLLDLSQCSTDGCALHGFAGIPYWSPDGRHILLSTFSFDSLQLQLFLDGQEPAIELGAGLSPFWLDNQSYGYIRPAGDFDIGPPQTELVTVGFVENDPTGAPVTVLASNQDLLAHLPPAERLLASQIFMFQALFHPGRPDWIFLNSLGRDAYGEVGYLFAYHRLDGEISLITSSNQPGPIYFSDDGRYLIANGQSMFHLYDIEQGMVWSQVGHYNYDWSADGQWLLLTQPNLLRFVAPQSNGYQFTVYHDFNGCQTAAWVNRE